MLPFTYEGIYYALASAKVLATVLIEKKEPQEYEKEWNKKFQKKFKVLLKLQKVFLYNNFTIKILMRYMRNKQIQEKTLKLWTGEAEIQVNLAFFLRVLKRIVRKD